MQHILDKIKANCVIDENQCWNWNNSLDKDGYGKITYQNKSWRLPRLTFTLVNGEISENLLVRHKCNNQKCCNPEHLHLGTHKDNNIDTVISGNSKGSSNLELTWLVRRLKTLKDRIDFYNKNTITINNGCLESLVLQTTKDGYYQVRYENKTYRLHRLILASKLNKNYDEINQARHTCRNNSCINPDHLIDGTAQDNSIDSRLSSKATKLSDIEVRELKLDRVNWDFSVRGNKTKFDKLWAERLNVSPITVRFIRTEKRWADI